MTGKSTDTRAKFGWKKLADMTIEDEKSFRHVELYGDLKEVLRREDYAFRTLPADGVASWDRALFLNLTFWGANEGGDVLVDASVPADVIAHAAWHRLAAKALTPANASANAKPSVSALFLGEAIASAFDLFLVGRLLGHAPRSSFLETQVPAMSDAAAGSGLDEDEFDALVQGVAKDPDRAFADLRELLFDASTALYTCTNADAALTALDTLQAHRFSALLHHYEIANWVLYARAYGDPAPAPAVDAVEKALREAKDPLQWLVDTWVKPALT